ncbi:MAG: ASCH domain-containing protein [Planctomycetales bacterium]|nr:ASCH domain-containing protein [Planctomycetales bacterium]
MVAYNFQKQFAEPIRSGLKTHTIRRDGKRRHARPGEHLQLYTGMRTRSCEKIIPDPICSAVHPIIILVGETSIHRITIERNGSVHSLEKLGQFAIDDGFESLEAFHRFWKDFHGVGAFQGRLISWGDFWIDNYDAPKD